MAFPPLPGKNRLHYYTADAGPPNQGKVPGPYDVEPSLSPYGAMGGYNMGMSSFGGLPGFVPYGGNCGMMGGYPGSSCFGGPQMCNPYGFPGIPVPYMQPDLPKAQDIQKAKPKRKPVRPKKFEVEEDSDASTASDGSVSTPPPSAPLALFRPGGKRHSKGLAPASLYQSSNTHQGKRPPFSGNRVKEQLATFPGNKFSHVFGPNNAVIHVFRENITYKYTPRNGVLTIPNYSQALFNVVTVSCDMTIANFIEGIDCKKRANTHEPYCYEGYPEEGIGIQELLEQGDGNFMLGSKIMLSDYRAQQTVGTIWPDFVGDARGVRPRYVVRFPI